MRRPGISPMTAHMNSIQLTITTVNQHVPPAGDGLRGHLDRPQAGDVLGGGDLELRGWIVSAYAPVAGLELCLDRQVMARTTPAIERHDVLKCHPGEATLHCGFSLCLPRRHLGLKDKLQLHVVTADGRRHLLATVKTRAADLKPGHTPAFAPVLLLSPGRSGTTLAMNLLSRHPGLLTTERHPFEGRVAQYFMQLYPFLLRKEASGGSTVSDLFQDRYCGLTPFLMNCPESREFIDGPLSANLLDFSLAQIDAYYAGLGARYGKPAARRFIEKANLANPSLWLFAELYPELREIVLVRDFRDIACSVASFVAKRGEPGFGFEGDFAAYMTRFAASMRAYVDYCRRRKSRVHVLRYEDLVRAPEKALERCLAFLGLERRPETVREMIAQALVPSEDTREHMTSASAAASIGRHRSELSPDQLQALNRELAESLEFFGYER